MVHSPRPRSLGISRFQLYVDKGGWVYRRALEDGAWFGRSKVFIIPFSKSFPSIVHGTTQHLEDLLQTRVGASKRLVGCAGEAMDGLPSQGSTVGFALVILVECRSPGSDAADGGGTGSINSL